MVYVQPSPAELDIAQACPQNCHKAMSKTSFLSAYIDKDMVNTTYESYLVQTIPQNDSRIA